MGSIFFCIFAGNTVKNVSLREQNKRFCVYRVEHDRFELRIKREKLRMEREEFCTLARQLRAGIMTLSRRFLKDEAEAEDNVQDTLLRLWTIREKLDEVHSVQALSYAICRNLCVSKLRQRRIIPMELNEEIKLISSHDSQWMMEEKENAQWLEERIEELPSSQMQILRMSQQDGLENSEIAEILSISGVTVRTALCKARKSLLEKLMKREAEQLKAVEL